MRLSFLDDVRIWTPLSARVTKLLGGVLSMRKTLPATTVLWPRVVSPPRMVLLA